MVPFEAPRVVEVKTLAEAEGGLLPGLTPEAVVLPGVDVAVDVEDGKEDEVEFLKEFGHGLGFAIAGDEAISDIIDRAGADPFSGVGTTGYNDCFAGTGRLFAVVGMYANA